MPELPKAYSPQTHENDIYRRWEASGYFNPDKLPNGKKRKPFVISMPPSNVTGELHLGHALGFTIQDIMVRYQRMRGRTALWLPGTDHAAIATQVVVERELRQQGIDRQTIGREKFLQHVWAWKEKYGSRITEQTKKLGASADWSRERFTMDPGMTLAVNTAFKRLYDDGLIYRGERIINWCPGCQSAISDLEVDHEDVPGKLWHLRYPLADGSGNIIVATTRPETMLGDTAVAVHPRDARYTALVGKEVLLPLVGRRIPIVADRRIDPAFGTGAVKVTPAHDPLDFAIGEDHHLPRLSIIGQDDCMTTAAGSYAGLTTDQARTKIIADLEAAGALEKAEDYIHAVGFCSRSKTRIEPLVSMQWFLKTTPLAKPAMAAVRRGSIRFLPKRFATSYLQWMANLRDWNISRQIWWGHRLPVWYRNNAKGQIETKVTTTNPGRGWTQDDDTLDTWFSSALWTFSTLGWPKKTSDLKRFHPTSVMETGWDIIPFWVSRMIMMSKYFLHQDPFRDVYIHGLILDAEGKKMSRSKGNGIDPMNIVEQYGADALRLSLIIGNAVGQDLRYSEQRAENYRNFVNKLWNVARFILSQPRPAGRAKPSSLADAWILDQLNQVIRLVTKDIDAYDYSSAGSRLYAFIWHDLADWYLEATKIAPNPAVLYEVLETVLKLVHPFAPFVSEVLWTQLHDDRLLMVEPWPKPKPVWTNPTKFKSFTRLQAVVIALRNFRAHAGHVSDIRGRFVDSHRDHLDAAVVTALSRVTVTHEERHEVIGGYRTIFLGSIEFQFPENYVLAYESWRIKERQQLTQYIASLEAKLANSNFVDHAPAAVIAAEREKLAVAQQRLMEL